MLLYWGWHVRFVYAFLPLILAQLVFAYAVDSLLTWSRRDTYQLGFGPFPVFGVARMTMAAVVMLFLIEGQPSPWTWTSPSP